MYDLKWSLFQDRLAEEQFRKPSDILQRLQDFMIQSMETGDVELLREATQRYKKFEVIHKNCDSTTALAYAKQLFSQTNDFSISELNDLLKQASRCRKVNRGRDSSSSSSSSSSSDDSSKKKKKSRKNKKHSSRRNTHEGHTFQRQSNPYFLSQRAELSCNYCGKPGHIMKNCYVRINKLDHNISRHNDTGNKKQPSKFCYKCKIHGHYTADCQETKPDSK